MADLADLFLSKCALTGKDYKLETVDMERLEPPYIIFSNHMACIDFELAAMVTDPNKENFFDISSETDSFYCYLTNPDIITKLAFAMKEIYKFHMPQKV